MIQTEYRDIPGALADGQALPFVYLRTLSRAAIGRSAELPVPEDLGEVEELRFFGSEAEIRILRTDAGLEAYRISDGDGAFLDETVGLLPGFGKKLIRRKLLRFDDDGQAEICAVRLVGWEG